MDPPHGPPPMELVKWQVESANARAWRRCAVGTAPSLPKCWVRYIVITGNDAQEAVKEAVSAVRRVCRVDCGLAFAPARAAAQRGGRAAGASPWASFSLSLTPTRDRSGRGSPRTPSPPRVGSDPMTDMLRWDLRLSLATRAPRRSLGLASSRFKV